MFVPGVEALTLYLYTSERDGEEIPAASNLSKFSLPSDIFILDTEVITDDLFK